MSGCRFPYLVHLNWRRLASTQRRDDDPLVCVKRERLRREESTRGEFVRTKRKYCGGQQNIVVGYNPLLSRFVYPRSLP